MILLKIFNYVFKYELRATDHSYQTVISVIRIETDLFGLFKIKYG